MADIGVRRKRASVWMWIGALLIAALLIWALAEMFGGGEDPVEESTVVEPVGSAPAEPPPIAAGLRVS